MNITVKDLLDSGVHFGHQTRRFNPKSKKYVYANRHGISVIDLEKTYAKLEDACRFVEETVASGRTILFVGTKKQAQEVIREAATAVNMPSCSFRWLGGTLTNNSTVKRSIEQYKKHLRWEEDGTLAKMHKKESAVIRRDMARMQRNFGGIVQMNGLPAALFVVDTKTEAIAVNEANRLGIPVVGLVDTNSDPSLLKYPIPGNDDSIKSVRIIVEAIKDAALAGLARREVHEPVQQRTVTVAAATTERQVSSLGRAKSVSEDVVPEKFSTDEV